MKTFDFKHNRKQETNYEIEENTILTKDKDFGSFQQKMAAVEMKKVIYLEKSMIHFSINLFVLIDNVGDTAMKVHYSYICDIQEVDGGEYATTSERITDLAKLKFVLVMKDKFSIPEIQLKSISRDRIFEVEISWSTHGENAEEKLVE